MTENKTKTKAYAGKLQNEEEILDPVSVEADRRRRLVIPRGRLKDQKRLRIDEAKRLLENSSEEALDDCLYLLRRDAIPRTAPERYADRADKDEDAVAFVGRVYGPWLTGEFTKADLRRLDRQAYAALSNWEQYQARNAGKSLPFKLSSIWNDTKELAASGGVRRNDLVKRLDRVRRASTP